MNRKWISVLLIFSALGSIHAAKSGSIIQNNVAVYVEDDRATILTSLDFGSPVRIHKQKGDLYYISNSSVKGWVAASMITVSSEKFSNIENSAILAPHIILENNTPYMFFYAKENIIKYNIDERKKESAYKSGFINNIYAYGKGSRLLVEGVHTNSSNIHNLRILHLDNGQYVDIVSYDNKKALFLDGEFSEDGKYLSLQFQVSGRSQIAVFLSENGEYVGTAKNASQSFWEGHKIILQDGNSLWNVDLDSLNDSDLSFNEDRTLIKLNSSEITSDGFESVMYNGVIYYETRKGIFAYDLLKQEKKITNLKSLDFDPGMNLNHIYNGNKHRLIALKKNGSSYNYFSGTNPKYKFVQFFDGYILYSRVVEKLDTFFISPVSDPYSEESYKYKSIDEIDAYSDSGILAEITHDKDLSAIVVEIPQKKSFFVILLKH